MLYQLRPELPADYQAVEELTYRAFQNFQGPVREYCDEHYLVHKMRGVPGFVPELSYVAEGNGQLLGCILYTRSHVLTPEGYEIETLTFGPVSVLPEHQNLGVGGALIRHTLEKARKLGHRAVLIMGHPAYYPRFGFRSAEEYGITTMDGKNFDAFMVLELYAGAMENIGGRYRYDPVFELPREEVAAFNREYGYPAI